MITSKPSASSARAGYRFPREVIAVAVRWYLRYGLSYRDVEELLAERGVEVEVEVDHVTVYRWVQTFTPEFIDAARPARHSAGDKWFVDETYGKVTGRWTYLYRAVDQHGQIIDVFFSTRRNAAAAREFFAGALRFGPSPVKVTTDRAPVYPHIVEELEPAARHVTEQYANNRVEADHGRLKAWLRPMRGLKRIASARTIAAGHAFVQNLRRGHYAITADLPGTIGSASRSTNSRCACDPGDPGDPIPACPVITNATAPPRRSDVWPRFAGVHQRTPAVALMPRSRWTLRHVAGFPGLGLLRVLHPSRPRQPTTGLATRLLAAAQARDGRDGSHVHSRSVRRDRRPAMPLQHRHDYYAADLHRGSAAATARGRRAANPR